MIMSDKKLPALNRVLIVGNLTRDPELRQTHSGASVANFRIAASRRYKDALGNPKEEVCFVGVVVWQRLADTCGAYLKKGSAVLIEGELQSRAWETEDGNKRSMVEIHAHKVQFLDRRPDSFREYDGETDDDGYAYEGAVDLSPETENQGVTHA
jgi:single-strand DNA-binding protein